MENDHFVDQKREGSINLTKICCSDVDWIEVGEYSSVTGFCVSCSERNGVRCSTNASAKHQV
jgi:hypothetical protein